jgi:hypothetical protein
MDSVQGKSVSVVKMKCTNILLRSKEDERAKLKDLEDENGENTQ